MSAARHVEGLASLASGAGKSIAVAAAEASSTDTGVVDARTMPTADPIVDAAADLHIASFAAVAHVTDACAIETPATVAALLRAGSDAAVLPGVGAVAQALA